MSKLMLHLRRGQKGASKLYRLPRAALLAGIAGVVLLAVSPTAGAAVMASPAPAHQHFQGPHQITCTPEARADHVHYSKGDASGHGSWDLGDCVGDSFATVTIQLQERLSGVWRNKGALGIKLSVSPGGGAGRRATARAKCKNRKKTHWRSVVGVVVFGLSEGIDTIHSPNVVVACRT
jgi:hypothetical protein